MWIAQPRRLRSQTSLPLRGQAAGAAEGVRHASCASTCITCLQSLPGWAASAFISSQGHESEPRTAAYQQTWWSSDKASKVRGSHGEEMPKLLGCGGSCLWPAPALSSP